MTFALHGRNLAILLLTLGGCLHVSSAQTADEISGYQAFQREYRKYISDIDVEISASRFSPWRAKLIAFKGDAQESFTRYAITGKACVSGVRPSKKECTWAFAGESILLGDMAAAGGLGDIGYNQNQAGSVRPQVEKWVGEDFSEKELEVRHYANDPRSFEPCISRARALKTEAAVSARVSDWNGALLSLRHSQLLMDDCSIQAKREFDTK